MDDLISRKAAIYAFRYACAVSGEITSIDIKTAERVINNLPSALPEGIARDIATIIENEKDMRVILENAREEQRWIPVSERLPERPMQVLVYARNSHFLLAKYDNMRKADGSYKDMWVTFDAYSSLHEIRNVMAWMPLPSEPHEE